MPEKRHDRTNISFTGSIATLMDCIRLPAPVSSELIIIMNKTYDILDMTASLAFRSATSISFNLSRQSKSLCPARSLGWIDVHFPCEGHIKTQIRVLIPKEYHEPNKLSAITRTILAIAEIPENETYDATFIDPATVTAMTQPVNRQGITDRL